MQEILVQFLGREDLLKKGDIKKGIIDEASKKWAFCFVLFLCCCFLTRQKGGNIEHIG